MQINTKIVFPGYNTKQIVFNFTREQFTNGQAGSFAPLYKKLGVKILS